MTSPTKPASHVWRGPKISNLPHCDVVSYVFESYGQYDLDKPILIDATDCRNSISMRNARTLVEQLASGFKHLELEDGDCICLNLWNNVTSPWILWPILFLGALAAGNCISGCNAAYTVNELVNHLKVAQAKVIIAHVEHLETIIIAAEQCSIPKSRILLLASASQHVPVGYLSWETLLDHGQSNWKSFATDAQARNTTAFLASTSGTTGLPKAAVLSHQYFIAQDIMRWNTKADESHEIIQLTCLPIFHAFAGQYALVTPLRHGIPTLILPRFKLDTFVDTISKYAVTDTPIVPPIATALMKLDAKDVHRLESLRYLVCAGAPLDAIVQSKLYDFLPQHTIVGQCWGTTETAWFTLFKWPEKDESGSVGRLLPGTELKVVDEAGQTIDTEGLKGEGLIRAPSQFNGYSQNPDANANAFDAEGFFKTGDLVYYQDGKVFIDGRIKDIIKVRGWQVSPAELEGIILMHPEIEDVAVVPFKHLDANGLEEALPCAFIVPKVHLLSSTHKPLNPEAIHAFLEDKVVSYKKLTGGVRFVDQIPRNATGKILRWKLQEQLNQDSDT